MGARMNFRLKLARRPHGDFFLQCSTLWTHRMGRRGQKGTEMRNFVSMCVGMGLKMREGTIRR